MGKIHKTHFTVPERPWKIEFWVDGKPVPKQSFRAKYGRKGYTPQRVKDWQKLISENAMIAMQGREMFSGLIGVSMKFNLHDKRHRDLDNLSKCVLDGLEGVVFENDNQVVELLLTKQLDREKPGVYIGITNK
jgi:Holliday junction resolvase RusA-like endonuclease